MAGRPKATATHDRGVTHGGARSGAGRPTKAGANRSEAIALRATEAEKAELVAAASAAGQSLSDFLIEAGLQRARGKSSR